MVYFYDDYVAKHYGTKKGEIYGGHGTYITPNGTLFDVDGYSMCAHAGGYVLPFFNVFIKPDRETFCSNKEELLEDLINWEYLLLTNKYEWPQKVQKNETPPC